MTAPEGYEPDFVVSVDVAALNMLPANAKCYEDRIDLAIDHHPSNVGFGKENCIEADKAACGEIVYKICKHFGKLTPAVALPLYVAVSTDCGCFVYSNTSAACHRTAAELMETSIDFYPINRRHFRTKSFKRLKLESMLTEGMQLLDGGAVAIVTLTLDMIRSLQATEEDMDNISAFVGQIEGVRTGVTIRQLTDTACKISLRTDPDELNASKVCALLGGGGHAAASGATVEASPEQTADMVIQAIRTVQNA